MPNQSIDTTTVIDTVLSVAGGPAPLHVPEITGREWEYTKDCLDTSWVSTAGGYVNRFEEMLASYTGAGQVSAIVNGTAALHLCLVAAGVEYGHEVIVPTLTFVATANAVAHCGAVPHFADIDPQTLGLDAEKLDRYLRDISELRGGICVNKRSQRVISAVVCVHAFGHPADLDGLVEVSSRHQLVLIEDAAESLGSFYKDTHTGNHGRLAALSFNGNKIVTTGGGGAIMTNDTALGSRIKHLSSTAKVPHHWRYEHDEVGFNYRLPNLNAAMGCAQLEQLEDFVARKRRLSQAYASAFAPVKGVTFLEEPGDCKSNYWLNTLILDNADQVEVLLKQSNEAGVQMRPAWDLLHGLRPFEGCPRMELSVAEDVSRRIVNIPSSPGLVTNPAE